MPLTEETVVELVKQWALREGEVAERLLLADFVYDCEVLAYDRADFLMAMNLQTPWRQVRILGTLLGATQAAAFFDGIDPTTNLGHRIAWLLDHDGFRVRRITANHCVLMTHSHHGVKE